MLIMLSLPFRVGIGVVYRDVDWHVHCCWIHIVCVLTSRLLDSVGAIVQGLCTERCDNLLFVGLLAAPHASRRGRPKNCTLVLAGDCPRPPLLFRRCHVSFNTLRDPEAQAVDIAQQPAIVAVCTFWREQYSHDELQQEG